MSSNSIRVSAALFGAAQREGALMSRSAAQQIEHWARLGVALEAAELSVADLAGLLRTASPEPSAARTGEDDPWAFKRALQARDLRGVGEGRPAGSSLSWFAGGKAKHAKLVGSPY